MVNHQKMSMSALNKVDAKISTLGYLPEVINELSKWIKCERLERRQINGFDGWYQSKQKYIVKVYIAMQSRVGSIISLTPLYWRFHRLHLVSSFHQVSEWGVLSSSSVASIISSDDNPFIQFANKEGESTKPTHEITATPRFRNRLGWPYIHNMFTTIQETF